MYSHAHHRTRTHTRSADFRDCRTKTLVHPKRRYVREGVLTWRGESEDNPSPYFFLFNDFLMYTTRRGNEEGPDEGGKAFEYITIVPLNFITLVEECEAEPNAFQVALEEELTLFVAPSPKARRTALTCPRLVGLLCRMMIF